MAPHTRVLHLALIECAHGVLSAAQRAVAAWKKWVEADDTRRASVESPQ